MNILNGVDLVTDYGDASAMPVCGGELNLKTLFKMITGKIK